MALVVQKTLKDQMVLANQIVLEVLAVLLRLDYLKLLQVLCLQLVLAALLDPANQRLRNFQAIHLGLYFQLLQCFQ